MTDSAKETISELLQAKSFSKKYSYGIHDLIKGKKVILYGAGNGLITFIFFVTSRYDIKIEGIIDIKFGEGGKCCNVPAYAPENFPSEEFSFSDTIAIITVGKTELHPEILETLKKLGFKNILFATDVYEYHIPSMPPLLEKTGFDYYVKNTDKILGALDLFHEVLSREIYLRFVKAHLQRRPCSMPSRDLEEQYFPNDIRLSKGYSRVINCGAYNGDTIIKLNQLHGKIDALACFEPDPVNFDLLQKRICQEHDSIADDVILFPCGVFNCDKHLFFSSGNAFNSGVSEKGDISIQGVAVDHVIPGFRPTFICMDVEGVEPEALRGAENILRQSKPDLAICVYHSPNHIWDIPLFIDSLDLGYKFYLRNYTSFLSETVLYGTVE